MKKAIIIRTGSSACNSLKADGLKTQFIVLRASLRDLDEAPCALHLANVDELCSEIMGEPSYDYSEKTGNKLKALKIACEVVIKEESEK